MKKKPVAIIPRDGIGRPAHLWSMKVGVSTYLCKMIWGVQVQRDEKCCKKDSMWGSKFSSFDKTCLGREKQAKR